MKRRYKYRCKTCNTKLQQNGYNNTKSGKKKRCRCPWCLTSRQKARKDLSSKYVLSSFVKYLLSTRSVDELTKDYSNSTFHRRVSPCWNINPRPRITGEIYPYIVIDATGVGHVSCAVAKYIHVINWDYGVRENSNLWISALSVIPRPDSVVCDGQKGILKALNMLWPQIIIQRCLVHVCRNIRVKLTNNPQTTAGKDLKWLVDEYLWAATNYEQMSVFIGIFNHLHELHMDFLDEKTWNQDKNSKKQWWYTHGRVRSSYRQIAKLLTDDQLFAFITHPELKIPRTSNSVEATINSRISELLLRHRGMNSSHQQRLVDWYLNSKTEYPFKT